jgi:hypothetical protein
MDYEKLAEAHPESELSEKPWLACRVNWIRRDGWNRESIEGLTTGQCVEIPVVLKTLL